MLGFYGKCEECGKVGPCFEIWSEPDKEGRMKIEKFLCQDHYFIATGVYQAKDGVTSHD